jgi:GNAT superfamily N-acetyltransferase
LWSDVLTNFSAMDVAELFLRNAVRLDNFYQLCAGLHSLPANPPRKIGGGPIEPLLPEDVAGLRARLRELPAIERKELLARIHFYQRGFRNGYALRDNGVIAYLQWIAYPSDNDVITGAYGRRFAALSPREVMLENAFTFPAFRGRGFLAFGTWELLKRARDQGYARAVTFVHANSLEALNTFMAVGFRVQRRLREASVCGCAWRFWGEEWKRRARIAAAQPAERHA